MGIALSNDVKQLADRPNFAHLATIMLDSSPRKSRFEGAQPRPDPELKHFDAMSLKYIGKPWPHRDEKSTIVLIIEVTMARYLSTGPT